MFKFNDNKFSTTKRIVLFSQNDLLANCGGLLGLFIGISLLSILEIIYYLTIRTYLTFRKNRINNYPTSCVSSTVETPETPETLDNGQLPKQPFVFAFLP